MIRFDIVKIYLRVIWDPVWVFVAKQGVSGSHWGSVRLSGVSETQWEVIGV